MTAGVATTGRAALFPSGVGAIDVVVPFPAGVPAPPSPDSAAGLAPSAVAHCGCQLRSQTPFKVWSESIGEMFRADELVCTAVICATRQVQ